MLRVGRRGDQVSTWLIILTGLIYAYVGAEQAWNENYPMALMYFSYSTANVGLYFMVK
jgi:hypothetical protein